MSRLRNLILLLWRLLWPPGVLQFFHFPFLLWELPQKSGVCKGHAYSGLPPVELAQALSQRPPAPGGRWLRDGAGWLRGRATPRRPKLFISPTSNEQRSVLISHNFPLLLQEDARSWSLGDAKRSEGLRTPPQCFNSQVGVRI